VNALTFLKKKYKSYDNINHMSILNCAHCEPLPLDGYIFGADFDLEWTGSQFIAKLSNFTLSDADDSARVYDVALDPSYVYPLGGNIVSKSYLASLPSDLQSGWHPCGVCGHPGYPAFFIFDPTSMVNTTSLIHTFPRIVHLGSYLQQSDAAHPPNVDFLMIVEEEVPGMQQPRYRATFPELFFKARYELPPGTVLYADIATFFALVAWTPEAQQNYEDPGWEGPFPASEPGVYILEARIEALVLATLSVCMSRTLQERLFHCWIALNAYLAVEANSWWMTPALPLVLVSFSPRHLQRLRLFSLRAASVRRRRRRSFWLRAKGVLLLVVLGTVAIWRYPSLVVRTETGRL
jgi:hypothetical protein